MIRFAFRALGFLVLAAAFIALLHDGTRSIAADQALFATGEQIWAEFRPVGQQGLDAAEWPVFAWLWTAVVQPLTRLPITPVLAVFGAALVLIGRKKKPKAG